MADLNSVRKVSPEPNSINLPDSVELLAGLKNEKRIVLDIGCSLTKVAYYSSTKHKPQSACHCKKKYLNQCRNIDSSNSSKNEEFSPVGLDDRKPEDSSEVNGTLTLNDKSNQFKSNCQEASQMPSSIDCETDEMSRLHFVKFQTRYLDNCLDFIRDHLLVNNELIERKAIKVTGRGVCKYANCIKDKLGVLIDNEDETCCLIKGTNYLLKNVAREAFSYQRNGNPECVFQGLDSAFHPYLLVDIGSGVSIIKVTGEDCYEKIGSLSTGGATFWGLGRLLTSAKEFDDLMELAENGDCQKVDLLAKDVSANEYSKSEVSGEAITASFGKICINNDDASQKKFSEADVARSLLLTILNSIGQVVSLYAAIHNVTKVYFGGHFLRSSPVNMELLSRAVNYWSCNKTKALFLRHEGYLGTVGAFLKGAEQSQKESSTSFGDQIYSKSSDGSGGSSSQSSGIDSSDEFSVCPLLLHPDTYCPDTVDLTVDEEAREYWLECFEETVEKFAKKAVESQPNDPTAKTRANYFKEKFLVRLQDLKKNPSLYGVLTVRSILDTIQLFLNEFEFPDPYLTQKEMENQKALTLFAKHIKSLDELDSDTRQRKLILYLIAGNMFDWGAKEVSALLETNNFGFEDALSKIPERPWLIDSLEEWIQRLEGPPHKCAVVFVDNSGLDIILGILPFVRELLRRGTEVILCSNSSPALNDVIHTELVAILKEVKCICPIIKKGIENGRLIAMETGQTGPCLDLRRIKKELCEEIRKRKVDLIVIEGMGRSVHTNLNTLFNCESLKVAVIKNRWLARRLGGAMFCVLCQYKRNPT